MHSDLTAVSLTPVPLSIEELRENDKPQNPINNVSMPPDQKTIAKLAKKIKRHLKERYGSGIKQVILYGSYARGEQTEDSDVDLVVVVDDELDTFTVEESLTDFLFSVLIEEGELVAITAIPEKRFGSYKSPFLLTVQEEGISI